MAEEQTDNPTPDAEDAKKGGLPIKLIAVVAVAMILEGAAIVGVFMMAGGPEPVEATELAEDPLADALMPVEVPVVADKFMNDRRGIAYTLDVEVVIVTQSRYAAEPDEEGNNAGAVNELIANNQNALRDDIARIMRRAEPAHLAEEDLLTLKRQIKDAINQRFGLNADGEYYVLDVFLPKFARYRSDN